MLIKKIFLFLKSNMLKIAIFFTLLILSTSSVFAYDQATSEPITIGAILPLSGEARDYGITVKRVAGYAVQKINKTGGIHGHQLKIIWKDGKCEEETAFDATQRLIHQYKVKIILGGLCSSETLAASAYTEHEKIILFSYGSTNPSISDAGDFVFRNIPSDATQGKLLASYALLRGFKKIGIIYIDEPYPRAVREYFVKDFMERGGIIFDEIYQDGTNNFRSIVERLNVFDVDAYFIDTRLPGDAFKIIQELKKQNIRSPLLGNDAVMSFGSSDDFKEHMNYLDGMVGPELGFNQKDPRFARLAAFYKKQYKKELQFPEYIARAYDAVFILKEAIVKTGNPTDTAGIRDYLYSIKNRRGLGGSLTFDKNGDPTSGYTLKIIKNGKIKILE